MALRRRDTLEARRGVDVGRKAREGAGSLAYSALVVGAIVLVLAVSAKFRKQWDFSALHQNSLSPQTREVLSRLGEPIEIKAFFTTRAPGRELFSELLDLYQRESSKIRVEFIDPVARPGAVRDLGLAVDEQGSRRDGFSVALRGPRKLVFRGTDEEAVTNAVIEVGSETPRVVGILRGYGEADPASPADAGLQAAVEALRTEYYSVRDVALSDGIPTDVTVLLAAGPKAAIPPPELERLERWLDGGGRLLALLEPGSDGGLNGVLEKFGLRALPERVLDTQENFNRGPEFLRVADYGKHAIVRGFSRSLPAALPNAGPVEHFDAGDQALFHDKLFESSKFSLGVAADGARRQGPFVLGAASWRRVQGGHGPERETRIVLIGDLAFAVNAYLPMAANKNLFLNCVGWLSQGEGLVSVRRQALTGQTLELRRGDRLFLNLALFGAPILVVLSGIAVFALRRGM